MKALVKCVYCGMHCVPRARAEFKQSYSGVGLNFQEVPFCTIEHYERYVERATCLKSHEACINPLHCSYCGCEVDAEYYSIVDTDARLPHYDNMLFCSPDCAYAMVSANTNVVEQNLLAMSAHYFANYLVNDVLNRDHALRLLDEFESKHDYFTVDPTKSLTDLTGEGDEGMRGIVAYFKAFWDKYIHDIMPKV